MKLTTKNVKTLSKNINKKFKEMSCNIKHTDILNLISSSFGYKCYNALEHSIDKKNIKVPKLYIFCGKTNSGKSYRMKKIFDLNKNIKKSFIFDEELFKLNFILKNKFYYENKIYKYRSLYEKKMKELYSLEKYENIFIDDLFSFLNSKRDLYEFDTDISSFNEKSTLYTKHSIDLILRCDNLFVSGKDVDSVIRDIKYFNLRDNIVNNDVLYSLLDSKNIIQL